jgi:hypothetical protein
MVISPENQSCYWFVLGRRNSSVDLRSACRFVEHAKTLTPAERERRSELTQEHDVLYRFERHEARPPQQARLEASDSPWRDISDQNGWVPGLSFEP